MMLADSSVSRGHRRNLSCQKRLCTAASRPAWVHRQYTVTPVAAAPQSSSAQKEKDAELLKKMVNYRYEIETPEGQLVVSLMGTEWLSRAADLLTDTFVDTKGIQPYRRYVRRNISTYLEQHHKMPPAAAVLTAVLRSEVTVSPEMGSLMLEGSLPELAPLSSSSGSSSSSSSSIPAGQKGSSAAPAAAAGGVLACNATTNGSSSTNSSQWGWWVQQPTKHNTDSSSSSSSSSNSSSSNIGSIGSSNTSTAGGTNTQQAGNASSSSSSNSSSSSSNSSAADDSEGGSVGSMVLSALQQLASGLGLQQQQEGQTRVVEQLIGVAEVSFREFTRSQYLTLNPPKKCAYLCNMAVSSDWRRRGVASHLITAAEDMCALAGEYDMYLHLRFKDIDTAGGLYRKAGFNVAKADWPILVLLGTEPRYLMKKQLAAPRMLVGQVLLPQQQDEQQEDQGSAAGEQQQQQQAPNAKQLAAAPTASSAA